jgi:type IV secretion system protein VirD4
VTNSEKITPAGLLFGVLISGMAGIAVATLYSTFRSGLNENSLNSIDPLAFWYQTPFYLGYASQTFYTGLMIIGVCIACSMLFYVSSRLNAKHYHGTARWAEPTEIRQAGYLKPFSQLSGPIFGKTSGPKWFGRYLSNGEQPHSLVVAPTRAGKGVGVVVPTLLTYPGSVIALDVKGELFELTSRARKAQGHRIYKFSPFDIEGRTHGYNPILDLVDMPPERRFAETRRLAVNLIAPKNKGAEGFIDGARDLFVAGVLACIERGTPTIGAVYDLFAQPGEKYKLFARLAQDSRSIEAQRIFDNMASNDTKILTSYTSILGDSGLNLWADPLVKAATTTSDFSVHDLRRKRSTIYLCVSPNDLEVIAPLIRLFFQQVVSVMQRSMPARDERHEVLFLMDEFKHLGRLEAIETAITTIAGYKGRFMFIIQSLSALTGGYEEAGKQNFLSNTGIQIFMATADDETPTYISKAIGERSFQSKSISHSKSRRFDVTVQYSEQGSPLLRAEQIRLLSQDKQIVLIKGQPPLFMPKVKYYEDRNLKRIFASQTGPLPEPAVVVPPRIEQFGGSDPEMVDGVADAAAAKSRAPPVADQPVAGKAAAARGGENTADVAIATEARETRQAQSGQKRRATPVPDTPDMVAQRLLLDRIVGLQQRKEKN